MAFHGARLPTEEVSLLSHQLLEAETKLVRRAKENCYRSQRNKLVSTLPQ